MSNDPISEEGILIGNQLDKGNIANPISKCLVRGFDRKFFNALDSTKPKSIHEVGCGEGRLSESIATRYSVEVIATDFSKILIEKNQERKTRIDYLAKSIYDLKEVESRDVIVCCEVLEHLERPTEGLASLINLGARYYVLSVPREPIWRILNCLRGKYLNDFGNTPGHLNHWTKNEFDKFLIDGGLEIVKWLNPFPWLMVVARINE